MSILSGRPAKQGDGDTSKKGAPVKLIGAPPFGGPKGFSPKLAGKRPASVQELVALFFKKDMAVIASGLGVLLFAPIVEHFVSNPSDEKSIQSGFGTREAFFGGTSPFEPGTGGAAPGTLHGGPAGNRITPLTGGHPGDLIIPEHDDKAASASADLAAPPTPAPKDESWGSVVKDAARAGAKGAFEAAGNPRVKSALTSALRKLSDAGGTGAQGGSAAHMPLLAVPREQIRGNVESNFMKVAAAPGYKGVSRGISQRTPEGARGAADSQGGFFNRSGSALSSLQQAANERIHGGGGAPTLSGGAGGGDAGKGPGASPKGEQKDKPESLIQLQQKMDMQKDIDLKWKKKEWDELGRSKMHEEENAKGQWQLKAASVQAMATVAAGALQAAGTVLGSMLKGSSSNRPDSGPVDRTVMNEDQRLAVAVAEMRRRNAAALEKEGEAADLAQAADASVGIAEMTTGQCQNPTCGPAKDRAKADVQAAQRKCKEALGLAQVIDVPVKGITATNARFAPAVHAAQGEAHQFQLDRIAGINRVCNPLRGLDSRATAVTCLPTGAPNPTVPLTTCP
ncbi:MAG: hypothetical protein HY059_09945 [Proteobacteria bacterium]|nr:hypothetical protein [Pseudomonadota bacterium]